MTMIEFRALLPTLAFALILPIPAITFWQDGAGRAYAFAYLFFGCAVMAAESFSRWRAQDTRKSLEMMGTERRQVWRSKVVVLSIAMLIEVTVFTGAWFAFSGAADYEVPLMAILCAIPALCVVPYLTLRTGKPFAGVLFGALTLGMVKILGCVLARVVYGPNALAEGYMSMSFGAPNLLVWFCIIGSLVYSMALFRLGFLRFQNFGIDDSHFNGESCKSPVVL